LAQKSESLDFDLGQVELYKKAQDIEKGSWDFYLEKANEVKEGYQKEIFLRLAVSSARWFKCRNEDASKKIFVATGILVFDFELFVGGHWSLLVHDSRIVLTKTYEHDGLLLPISTGACPS